MSTTVTFDCEPEDEIETDSDGVPLREGWYLDPDGFPCYIDHGARGTAMALYVETTAGWCGYTQAAKNGPYRRCPPFTLRWNGNYDDYD